MLQLTCLESLALTRNPPIFLALVLACLAQTARGARYDGQLTIRVLDKESSRPIPARMELRNSRGRPVRVRPKGAVSQDDYFVFDGEVTLELKKGKYQFLIEAGPEYQTRPGHFTIERHAEDSTEVTLQRRVNMQTEGWWAGDLDVRHRPQDLPLLMQATRVNFVPLFVRENVRGKCKEARLPKQLPQRNFGETIFGPKYALDHRRGGGLLLFDEKGTEESLNICSLKADSPSPILDSGAETVPTIVALNPFAWDLPVWIASGKLDAIQVIHRHALADNAVDNEGWGYKRDKAFFPGKAGNGRWSEKIYHHLLNCGLRIPPTAGSGAGANKNPIGTNRVYVQCGEQFSSESWFAGLREGKVIVTNGPLLRTRVSGHPPGHLFQLDQGESREFQIGLDLAFYEKARVEYLEILKNGRIEHEIRLDEFAKQQGRLPPLKFDESGWFLVRAMTSSMNNYQYATTGPYYVQSDAQTRISRSSVQFFITWLEDAAKEFSDKPDVLATIKAAEPFWRDLLAKANAE